MNKKFIYSGIVAWLFAAILAVFNLTRFETVFGDANLVNVSVYPAAFFAL
ncbi:MAG: hypothetical protein GWN61_17745, partial [candidate division Zixibacteria bacterium]|nr:hypothetical protein [candidate division Zixibacteria bacterium]NIS47711.1 hypothetical protein [candidate division Zixibacteria bacterium]NIU15816.1 hypothetical protein [candidate division Zixibacteria bacterium]NIV07963.1 hypothetical protein [candidate division Zixibacteria bacterium]NIW47229.1 hypothetical protein [Gammaproteobacteria bacterium]